MICVTHQLLLWGGYPSGRSLHTTGARPDWQEIELPTGVQDLIQCNAICRIQLPHILSIQLIHVLWSTYCPLGWTESRDNVITQAKKCHLWGGFHCACIRFTRTCCVYHYNSNKTNQELTYKLKRLLLRGQALYDKLPVVPACRWIRFTFLQSVLEARSCWSYLAMGGAPGAPTTPVRIACKPHFRLFNINMKRIFVLICMVLPRISKFLGTFGLWNRNPIFYEIGTLVTKNRDLNAWVQTRLGVGGCKEQDLLI